jgi:hypothetical protein
MFPSLHQLRRESWLATPVAYAAAQSAAAFVDQFPGNIYGVHPPEALPREVRVAIVRTMRRRGLRLISTTRLATCPLSGGAQ